jgi:2-hydroxy-3-oxopropionate reductase
MKPDNTTVAFIGVGLMGMPMALNLLAAGYKLQVWNRTRSKAEALESDNLDVADTVCEALDGARCVITMLENGPVVDHVVYDSKAYLTSPDDTLFIDMSSTPPETARNHSKILKESGRRHLDAPVSGGTVGASQACLSIMAGGQYDDFLTALPLLSTLGEATYIGGSGCGQLAKLANQAIVGITIGAVSEALLLAAAGGADPVAVRKALSKGFAGSRILELHGQRMIDRDFMPGATCRVQLKDLQTIIDTARHQHLNLPLTQRVFDEYLALIEAGHEQCDHSALLLQLESRNAPVRLGDKPDIKPMGLFN